MRPRHPLIARWVLGVFVVAGVGRPVSAATSSVALTLADALDQARRSAPELLLAAERQRVAELNVDRAWALLKPNLSLSLNYTHLEPRPNAFPDFRAALEPCRATIGPDGQRVFDLEGCLRGLTTALDPASPTANSIVQQDTLTARGQITWNILNGRALPLLDQARTNVSVEAARAQQDLNRLLFQVTRAYYAAVVAQQGVEATARAGARAEARRALAAQRRAVGEEPELVFTLQSIAVEQAELERQRATQSAAQARLALAFTIGAAEPVGPVVRPPRPELPPDTREALVQRALAEREDVRVALGAVAVAERGLVDAWWKFAPTIGVFGAYRYSNVPGLSGQTGEWSLGANLQWLLYDGGLRYADVAEAASQIRSARVLLDRTQLLVRQDLERAEARLVAARLDEDRARLAKRLAEARRDVASTQARAGASRAYDLVEADDALRDAELAISAAELDHDLAKIELLQAAGRYAP